MFVKFSRVKNACLGHGGERERALDNVFGIWVTVFSRLTGANQEAPYPDTGQTIEEGCHRYF